jgi:hypothetical protein
LRDGNLQFGCHETSLRICVGVQGYREVLYPTWFLERPTIVMGGSFFRGPHRVEELDRPLGLHDRAMADRAARLRSE